MRIICAHNFYLQPGGEDTAYKMQVELLREQGHQVFVYERHNRELETLSPFTGAIEAVWSQRTITELSKLLDDSGAELVHFTNTFLRISPAAYHICKSRGAAVVQDLHNYRLLCPAANFLRNGKPCEDCLGKTFAWPAIQHACWRASRPQTAVVALGKTIHQGIGTWHTKIDRFVALTNFARQKFIQGGLPKEKITVKPNFVHAGPPQSQRENFALFVGRLSEEKGVVPLLAAWENLDIPLKIVGDGPMQTQVKQAAQRSGSTIEWLGRLEPSQVTELMARARALIFPSICYEGMPLSILEAFASGLPVIASKLGAMQEMINDKYNGVHFEAGNPQDLAEKVNWFWAQPTLLTEVSQNAHEEYIKKYTPEANYELLMDIYQQAIDNSKHSEPSAR